jgi:5-methylthioadenosine/S-adenosylhomocysteine deaminase
MRGRQILTIDVPQVQKEAQVLAGEIDAFIRRLAEDNLNKLITIGGVEQEQSFELQAKARLDDRAQLDQLLNHAEVKIAYERLYHQYDHYFVFDNGKDERIRYREDETRDAAGNVAGIRARLTYTSAAKEGDYGGAVVLSRSRFIAPAIYPLRFYQEYFHAPTECEVEKMRHRWSINYKDVHFYVNYDEMKQPDEGALFVEIKARTWSPQDAEDKAALLREILTDVLKIAPDAMVRQEYVDMALAKK